MPRFLGTNLFVGVCQWAQNDRKTLEKIKALIADIHRNGLMSGIGKPEKLLGQSGEYSRRITTGHRLVYRLDEDRLKILSCRGHYQE